MSKTSIVTAKALELGATFSRVKTKSVSFQDLARDSRRFIRFYDLAWTNGNQWDVLKESARSEGFILSESI